MNRGLGMIIDLKQKEQERITRNVEQEMLEGFRTKSHHDLYLLVTKRSFFGKESALELRVNLLKAYARHPIDPEIMEYLLRIAGQKHPMDIPIS